jgi:hypothetical protein
MDIEDIKSKIEFYVESKRPADLEIRKKIDIGYTFQSGELEIFELRPRWDNPVMIQRHGVVKAKYIKSKKIWKIYWLRATLKWNGYEPCPEVKTLPEFFKVLDEDKHGCFWG